MQAHIFGPPVVAGRVLWNRICQSFHPPIHLSRHFLGIGILVFSKFWLCVRKPDKVVFDRVRFFLKKKKEKKMHQKWGKWAKKRVFWIYWKVWSLIFSEFGLCEALYYLPYFCANPIFGKYLVPEMWPKILLAN